MQDRSIRAEDLLLSGGRIDSDLSRCKYAQPEQLGKGEGFTELAKNDVRETIGRMRAPTAKTRKMLAGGTDGKESATKSVYVSRID
jgi:hypothetical protein